MGVRKRPARTRRRRSRGEPRDRIGQDEGCGECRCPHVRGGHARRDGNDFSHGRGPTPAHPLLRAAERTGPQVREEQQTGRAEVCVLRGNEFRSEGGPSPAREHIPDQGCRHGGTEFNGVRQRQGNSRAPRDPPSQVLELVAPAPETPAPTEIRRQRLTTVAASACSRPPAETRVELSQGTFSKHTSFRSTPRRRGFSAVHCRFSPVWCRCDPCVVYTSPPFDNGRSTRSASLRIAPRPHVPCFRCG